MQIDAVSRRPQSAALADPASCAARRTKTDAATEGYIMTMVGQVSLAVADDRTQMKRVVASSVIGTAVE